MSQSIGRVGALAVALGVGLAVASAPAVAWADGTGQSSSALDAAPASQDRDASEDARTDTTTADGGDEGEHAATARDHDAAPDRQIDQEDEDVDPAEPEEAPPAADVEKSAERQPESLPAEDARSEATPHAAHSNTRLFPKWRARLEAPAPGITRAEPDIDPADAPLRPAATPLLAPPDVEGVTSGNSTGELVPLQAPKAPEKSAATPAPVVTRVLNAVHSFFASAFRSDVAHDSPLLWMLMGWVRRQSNDGSAASALAAANSAPVAIGDAFAGIEDKVVKGNVLSNDSDVDGNVLTAILAAGPAYGIVTLSANGSFVYTPNINYHGTDTFTYTASDGSATSNAAVVTVTLTAVDDVVFTFAYGTGSQYWTPQARAALEAAANRLSEYFATRTPVTITYNVTGENNASAGYLARGGTAFGLPSRPAGFSNAMVKKITSRFHTDANRRAADGQILWNFAYTYSYDDSPAINEIDFQSVAMHELLHSLGYQSVLDGGVTNRRTWLTYDKFIVDHNGAKVIDRRYRFDSGYTASLAGENGGLFFGGANAVAAYGGPVPLQAYSLSHLRSSTFPYNSANRKLMGPTLPNGTTLRTISPVELGVLRDLGYTVVSPPQSIFQNLSSVQAV